ncbi:MAG: ATPase [Burkholderia sp.]|nr:ATPase [Burkholderia sp.]
MLNELEALSKNIIRLINLNQKYHSEQLSLKEQVSKLSIDANTVREEIEQLRDERNSLTLERDMLSSRIEDTQARLNVILNKLSLSKSKTEINNNIEILEKNKKIHIDGDVY